MPADITKAINKLKTDLTDNNNLLRQEINSKLDMLRAEVHNLSDRVEEAESRVETVERWVTEATEALSSCLKQRILQHKINYLESSSRCNDIHIFGVVEGGEGEDLGIEFVDALI